MLLYYVIEYYKTCIQQYVVGSTTTAHAAGKTRNSRACKLYIIPILFGIEYSTI